MVCDLVFCRFARTEMLSRLRGYESMLVRLGVPSSSDDAVGVLPHFGTTLHLANTAPIERDQAVQHSRNAALDIADLID